MAVNRQALLAERQRTGPGTVIAIPAPLGGWNARDSIDAMEPTDAITLNNWFPGFRNVSIRPGFAQHATGVGSGAVETITEYNFESTRHLIAAGGGSIYNATAASSATSLGSGFSEDRWQSCNFNGALGLVNGTDAPQVWDGSSLGAMTVSGSGLTVANLFACFAHQSRTYFLENSSQAFWYSDVNALGGALTEFPLGTIGALGGNLICAGSLNVEGGSDVWGGGGIGTDLAVFVTDAGQAVVYEGDDPGTLWRLVGVYNIGTPIDAQAIHKVGGDLIIGTNAGYVSLLSVLAAKKLTGGALASNKIIKAAVDAVDDYGANAGWSIQYYPKGHMLIINVPVSSTESVQHVMNTETLAWCRFTDINTLAWGRYSDQLYFGGASDGKVYLFDNGVTTDAGSDIVADGETAYTDLGARGALKQVVALRPVFEAAGTIDLSIAPQFDFKQAGLSSAQFTLTAPGVNWEADPTIWEQDEETWGSTDPESIVDQWFLTDGVGYSVGTRVRIAADDMVSWNSTTYRLRVGDGLV